jgi:2-octaprenyl-6-methoxyphenol hydroxylase
MARQTADIVISGGGVAGLTAAAAFGMAGYSVICVDPAPPVTDADTDGADLRTTAFLQPARDVLIAAGLWDRLAPHAAALNTMRIVDTSGSHHMTRDFNAADLGEAPFGWNLSNWLLRREMVARLSELPNVDFRPGTATVSVATRTAEAHVRLSDGATVVTPLVIAADGRNSPVRNATSITVHTTRFGQKALAFAVTHDAPHDNISTEVHQAGGPFTLVPLPDRNGKPCSGVVWMDRGPEVVRRAALPLDAFEAELNARSGNVMGPLALASRLTIWPMIAQLADRFDAERIALMAEAAHVVPPIGAQGLNMSLNDLAALLDLAGKHDLGSAAMLSAYTRARHRDVATRVAGIIALNRASMAGVPVVQAMRSLGLRALHDVAPVRRTVMQAGLGARG